MTDVQILFFLAITVANFLFMVKLYDTLREYRDEVDLLKIMSKAWLNERNTDEE